MANIWMLTAANLKRSKGQTVSLLVFVMIAALLLNMGLVMSFRIGGFFDEQAELSHTAHFTGVYEAGSASIESGRAFMENHPDVTEIETMSAVGGWGKYVINAMEMQGLLIFTPVTGEQKMDAPVTLGDSLPLTGGAVYIPNTLMLSGGYSLGDSITFELAGKEINFTVAGGTKEIMFGSQTNPFYRIYMSDEKWNELKGVFPENGQTLLSARLLPGKSSSLFQAEYGRAVASEGLVWAPTYDIAKSGRINVATIASSVLVAFSVMLVLVSLIVIRFRIISSIEESMINIGAQKAIGYLSAQIISSVAMQFGMTALLGGILGIAASQAVIPLLMEIWKPTLGFEWTPVFDTVTAAVSVAAVLFTSLMVSWLSARRINKLHPLVALRGGLTTHSWSKNYFPLDKTRGSLPLLIALKQTMQNKKGTAAISLIVAVLTMASIVGLTLNYNLNERRGEFARSIFGEIPSIDVLFMLNEGNDGDAFRERVSSRPEVRKAFGYTGNNPLSLSVDETTVSIIVAEDTSLMESEMMIEGRYPKHGNEIALGSLVLKSTGKKVGDTVMVGNDGNASEYLVTGIVQTTEGNGINGLLDGDGMRLLDSSFDFLDYAVYLNEGIDPKVFIESVRAEEENLFEEVIEEQSQVNNLLDSISGIFIAITAFILAATVFIIILVLYMVLKTTILRRKRELGIQKAIGFTTLELMNQIALGMTPIILIGAVLGAVIAYFAANPIVVTMMSSLGIQKLSLVVPVGQTVITSIALVILAYFVSMLIAWRIRKISAYALVTE